MIHLKPFCERRDWGNSIAIYLSHDSNGQASIAKPIEMEVIEDNLIASPTMEVSMRTAQALMDELWQCGLRPVHGSGSAGSLEATEKHLADMRSLAFGKLKIDKP